VDLLLAATSMAATQACVVLWNFLDMV
jgi:hypothetical protein